MGSDHACVDWFIFCALLHRGFAWWLALRDVRNVLCRLKSASWATQCVSQSIVARAVELLQLLLLLIGPGRVLPQGYLVSPFLAYNFSELIESHAVDTYSEFLETNKELLQSLPPSPQVRVSELWSWLARDGVESVDCTLAPL